MSLVKWWSFYLGPNMLNMISLYVHMHRCKQSLVISGGHETEVHFILLEIQRLKLFTAIGFVLPELNRMVIFMSALQWPMWFIRKIYWNWSWLVISVSVWPCMATGPFDPNYKFVAASHGLQIRLKAMMNYKKMAAYIKGHARGLYVSRLIQYVSLSKTDRW